MNSGAGLRGSLPPHLVRSLIPHPCRSGLRNSRPRITVAAVATGNLARTLISLKKNVSPCTLDESERTVGGGGGGQGVHHYLRPGSPTSNPRGVSARGKGTFPTRVQRTVTVVRHRPAISACPPFPSPPASLLEESARARARSYVACIHARYAIYRKTPCKWLPPEESSGAPREANGASLPKAPADTGSSYFPFFFFLFFYIFIVLRISYWRYVS